MVSKLFGEFKKDFIGLSKLEMNAHKKTNTIFRLDISVELSTNLSQRYVVVSDYSIKVLQFFCNKNGSKSLNGSVKAYNILSLQSNRLEEILKVSSHKKLYNVKRGIDVFAAVCVTYCSFYDTDIYI